MEQIRSIAEWMAERGLDLDQLLAASGLERRVLEAIVHGRYTPSPQRCGLPASPSHSRAAPRFANGS